MDFQLNLQTETVKQACLSKPCCVPPTATVRDVVQTLRENRTGAALVSGEDGVLQGIFTERDALRLLAHGKSLDGPIAEVMTRDPVTVTAKDVVGDAIAKMSKGGYRRLPVVDEAGRAIGVVKTSMVVHYLVDHFPSMIYNLPPDPHHVTQEREGA